MTLKKRLFMAISCFMVFISANLSFAGFSQRLQDKSNAIMRNTERMKNETNYKVNSNGNCLKLEREVIKLVNQEREKINEEREENGEEPLKILKVKNVLRNAARARSKEMYKHNYFEHKRSNGDDWATIFDEAKYKIKNKQRWGENIQKGLQQRIPTPQAIFDGFKKSKKHYEAMIGDFEYTGVGVYCKKEGEYYRWYLTQHFMTFSK